MTKLLNAASRGGRGAAETTAKLTVLSNSYIVIDRFIVCRHVIMSKCAVIYLFYSCLNTVCSTFNLLVRRTGGTQVANATAVA